MITKTKIIDGVILSPLKKINVSGGNVLHAMKKNDSGYMGYGEAYFSMIESWAVKGWKQHHKMTLNLVVPVGSVKFVIYDDRLDSKSFKKYMEVNLSYQNYCRLTIPPKLWLGFQGIYDSVSTILNIADMEHFSSEVSRKEINEIEYDWGKFK